MAEKDLRCSSCGEMFSVQGVNSAASLACPRCRSKDIDRNSGHNLIMGPPRWEFLCLDCRARFNIAAPSGPDEVKQIGCPRCLSKKVKWMQGATDKCPPTGG